MSPHRRIDIMTETRVDMEENEYAVIIRMEGIFDSNNFLEFQKKVRDVVDRQRYKFIFDLSEVGFLSSLVIGVLFATHITCKRNEGFLFLSGISHQEVKKMVSITRLDKILTVYETLEEAIEKAKTFTI